jgi:dynein heavy chain
MQHPLAGITMLQIGWRPLLTSWLQHKLPAAISSEQQKRIHDLFMWTVDPCLAFLRRDCHELVQTCDAALVTTTMQLLSAQLQECIAASGAAPLPNNAALEGAFVFSLVWSIGGALDKPSSERFDAFVRKLLAHCVDDTAQMAEDAHLGLSMDVITDQSMAPLAVTLPPVSSDYCSTSN